MDITIVTIVFNIAILIFSVVIHEISHGFAANALGDDTAKHAGRLTMNPLVHLDPVGSFIVPLASFLAGGFVIGWAKPVPYNPAYFRSLGRNAGSAIVGAAGPAANIIMALVFGLALRWASIWMPVLGGAAPAVIKIFIVIVFTNLALAVFNFMPIPPLDGSKILFYVMPEAWRNIRAVLERFQLPLLLIFVFYSSYVIGPAIRFFFRAISGIGQF